MRTDELIDALVGANAPVRPAAAGARFGAALLASLAVAVAGVLLLLGPRPDLAATLADADGWPKHLLAVALAGAGWLACTRAARPGADWRGVGKAIGLPVAAIAVVALAALAAAEPGDRLGLVLGRTWRVCTFAVALTSVPAFVAAMLAMRGLAPTRLRAAGAAAGLLAGGVGAAAYALHCPESAAPFVAVWYGLGIAVPVAAGAALGPRLLRW
jgi:hypothetical protein